jgi:hypothetical protein
MSFSAAQTGNACWREKLIQEIPSAVDSIKPRGEGVVDIVAALAAGHSARILAGQNRGRILPMGTEDHSAGYIVKSGKSDIENPAQKYRCPNSIH